MSALSQLRELFQSDSFDSVEEDDKSADCSSSQSPSHTPTNKRCILFTETVKDVGSIVYAVHVEAGMEVRRDLIFARFSGFQQCGYKEGI